MIKYLPKAVLTFLLLALFTFSALAAVKLVWNPEQVIFSDSTVSSARVVTLSDGRYRMYYQQGSAEIKSAVSTDGKSFQAENGIRAAGAMPAIIKLSDGRWRMYFRSTEGGSAVFKSATSTDGLIWTAEPGVRLAGGSQYDPDDILHPSVIELPNGGGYRLYYDGEVRQTEQEFIRRVLSATSADGLTWTKDAGIRIDAQETTLNASSVFSANAVYKSGQYILYFTAQRDSASSGIYLASSTDGLSFNIQKDPLLTTQTEEAANYPQDPFVLEFPEGKRMYYWTLKGGVSSAIETQETIEDPLPGWKQFIKNLLDKIDLGDLKLPTNWELFIIPGILLTAGAIIVYLFLKFSRK